MITPISFLWKQFNGPQITAFCQGIFNYMRDTYDSIMEYWNVFSIKTASNAHLTLLGGIQGIARPLIPVTGTTFFMFSLVPEEGTYYPDRPYIESDRGLSDVNGDMSIGGKFIALDDDPSHHPQTITQLPSVLFRQILRSNSDSEASMGSLAWLDDILYGLWQLEHPTGTAPDYSFKILEEEDLEQYFTRACGDIVVNIGTESGWTYPAELVAEFRLLGQTLYYPTPTLYAVSSAG